MKFRPLLASLVILSLNPGKALASPPQGFTGRVVAVSDGDTIQVMHNGKPEKIRLGGIDCPEKSQAFGKKAKQQTSILAFGQTVTVSPVTTDRYGRIVADVILPKDVGLNRELVRSGMCWWYRAYAPKDKLLESLEADARRSKRGLWVDKDPIPPWEFRKNGKSESALPETVPVMSGTMIRGNKKSRVYHLPGCPSYGAVSEKNVVEFLSEDDAKRAGFRRAGDCN